MQRVMQNPETRQRTCMTKTRLPAEVYLSKFPAQLIKFKVYFQQQSISRGVYKSGQISQSKISGPIRRSSASSLSL
jgi:hypothetical protein